MLILENLIEKHAIFISKFFPKFNGISILKKIKFIQSDVAFSKTTCEHVRAD
jgi:hypothetical protein